MTPKRKLVSLILPVYDEEASIDLFLSAVNAVVAPLSYDFEFIFINDGSTDATAEKLLAARKTDPRIKSITFSRNFGKDVALSAGFRFASGDAVIPMDVDLQDPPELIRDFVRKWEEGHDVVLGVRRERPHDSPLKRLSAKLFYVFFNVLCGKKLVPNAGDYRLMNRASVDALNRLPERVRFMKGLYAWVGYQQALVYYERPARARGTTKWNTLKLWNFALDGITGFSTLPLRIWSYLGLSFAVAGFAFALYRIVRTLVHGVEIPGYASTMVVLLVLGGLILFSLGIMGEYLGRIYEEAKARPLYLIKETAGFADDRAGPRQSSRRRPQHARPRSGPPSVAIRPRRARSGRGAPGRRNTTALRRPADRARTA